MKTLLPLVMAGSAFASAAIVGLLCGVLLASRRGDPQLAPIGLLLGGAIGGYGAFRIVAKAMR